MREVLVSHQENQNKLKSGDAGEYLLCCTAIFCIPITKEAAELVFLFLATGQGENKLSNL